MNQLREFIRENNGTAVKVMRKNLYDAALVESRGSITGAARLLGVSRSALTNYINECGSYTRK